MTSVVIRWLGTAILVLSTTRALAANRALLVGIDEYKNVPQLRGCVNDIVDIKRVLTRDFGFRESEIKSITNKDATRENILASFERWLVDGTREGDSVVFYYSGHGSFMRGPAGDTTLKNGMKFHQTICPYETKPPSRNEAADPPYNPSMISDLEIGVHIRALEKRRTLVVYDSCHSGGGVKGLTQYRFLPPRDERGAKGIVEDRIYHPEKPLPPLPTTLAFVAAAGPTELAADGEIYDGRPHGAFTAALLTSIDRMRGENRTCWIGKASLGDLLSEIRRRVGDAQHPEATAPSPALLTAPLATTLGAADASCLVSAPPQEPPSPIVSAPAPRPARVSVYSTLGNSKIGADGTRQETGRLGQSVQLAIKSDRAGYLYLFQVKEVDGKQEVRLLEPLTDAPIYVGVGERVLVPSAGKQPFALIAPAGTIRVAALVSPERLADLDSLATSTGQRSLSPDEVRDAGSAVWRTIVGVNPWASSGATPAGFGLLSILVVP